MSESGFAKCACAHCGTHLEYPLELAGHEIECPNCSSSTPLAAPVAPATSPEASQPCWTFEDIQQGFTGRIRRPWTSPPYLLALMIVAGIMLLLPAFYLLMIAATSYGVFLWGDHGRFLFHSMRGGVYVMLIRTTLYLTPMVAGLITVFFMVKPLLARPGRHAQPLALNPETEPVVYAFVREVARQVGSPLPARIDLDCQLNASAGFRGGWSSLVMGDLVLTLGLPFVAALSARELAGVVAHELGHFRQGLAMRLSYVVRGINGWLARVIYQRDAWDEALQEWATESESLAATFIVLCAGVAIWISRSLLKLLLLIGHAASTALLRQMEFDADRCEYRLAGSAAFESTVRRLHVLHHALNQAYKDMRAAWNQHRRLPDNLPAYLLLKERRLTLEERERIENRLGLRRAPWHETHPSDAERIRRARLEAAPGIVALEGPASALFGSFDVPARQVTFVHYSDDLGLPIVSGALDTVHET